jgi:ribose-phosphate pyrophosphokinase
MSILALSGVPQSLIESLQRTCAATPIEVQYKRFPDGEQYLRILAKPVPPVTVVQSIYPDQDRKLVELYLALEALNGLDVHEVNLVITYMAYARQDKRFLEGEPISVKALYMPLKLYKIKKILTLDIHSIKIPEILGLNIRNVLPHAYLVEKAEINIDFVLSPDKGAIHRAQVLAEKKKVAFDYLEKYRDRTTGEITVTPRELNVKGMNVAIVDDIISTGGTIAKATQILRKLEANKVYAIVTHALISEKTIETLSNVGLDMLITSNSIRHPEKLPPWIRVIDVGELLCKELNEMI